MTEVERLNLTPHGAVESDAPDRGPGYRLVFNVVPDADGPETFYGFAQSDEDALEIVQDILAQRGAEQGELIAVPLPGPMMQWEIGHAPH